MRGRKGDTLLRVVIVGCRVWECEYEALKVEVDKGGY